MQALPAFEQALLATGLIADPWIDGTPRFDPTPVVLPAAVAHELADAAHRLCLAYAELVRWVVAHPKSLRDTFRLTPAQELMFRLGGGTWHGHARADVFRCRDGRLQICELNCDTPSGFAEAVALGRTADGRLGADPNAALGEAFVELVREACARRFPGRRPRVGIVYPTELTEDLGLVAWWRDLFAAQGWSVAFGSPFNLGVSPGGQHLCLLGQPCDVILRHYKTDWWGERETIWTDEAPYPDPAPLDGPLGLLLAAETEGRAVVLNPFGAVVPQNKRAMALLWQRVDEWSARTAATVRQLVPFTAALEAMDPDRLRRDRADWVLKSNYGCEGEEVIVGARVTDAAWSEAVALARPERWVVQRRFEPLLDATGREANHGVFVVGGEPVGLYTRLSEGPTTSAALSVPTLVDDAEAA